jgi:hypothetical protein
MTKANIDQKSRKKSYEEFEDAVLFSNDFWELYKKKLLPLETQKYVVKIISGDLISFDPKVFNFEGQPIDLY